MSVTIASTTSTQAQLDHAVSDDWRTPPPIVEEAPAPDAEGETAEVTEASESTESDKPKRKGGFQKKIDRLVSRTTSLESDLEKERRLTQELRARLDGKSETRKPEPVATDKPRLEKFKNTEEFVEALTDWKLAQKERTEQQQAEAGEHEEIVSAYNRRVAELRAEHDDFDEVVGQASEVKIPEGAFHAILEMDNGPDVAYYLGQNPEIAKELMGLRPFAAVARVGKIAAELMKSKENNHSQDKEKRQPPPPVRAVGGSSARSSIPLDQLSGAEYVRVRNQQVRERGRR